MPNEGRIYNQNRDSPGGDAPNDTTGPQQLNLRALSVVIRTRKMDTVLWAVQLLTIVLATFFMIPLTSSSESYWLTVRYASRKNQYNRTLFYEIRMKTEHFILSQDCPKFIGSVLRKCIDIICELAHAAD
ncbi:unnamed protein product [Orchesella dallaii]|uniref:Uncharacterized protein n=1 Tax=Orchesella dallaii TaxID=48710 RepID=A0ABP1S4X1_9HEXA